MQETRNTITNQIRQQLFEADSYESLKIAMDGAVQPSEVVIRRREVSKAELHAVNRHERRKARCLARRSKS